MALRLPATPPASNVWNISTVYERSGESTGSVNSGIGLRLSDRLCCVEVDTCAEKGGSLRSIRRNTMSEDELLAGR